MLYKALDHHKISYALAWRNAGFNPSGEPDFYVPYKGQASEKDFKKFSEKSYILFQKDMSFKSVYK